jgi:hypothetical protein
VRLRGETVERGATQVKFGEKVIRLNGGGNGFGDCEIVGLGEKIEYTVWVTGKVGVDR